MTREPSTEEELGLLLRYLSPFSFVVRTLLDRTLPSKRCDKSKQRSRSSTLQESRLLVGVILLPNSFQSYRWGRLFVPDNPQKRETILGGTPKSPPLFFSLYPPLTPSVPPVHGTGVLRRIERLSEVGDGGRTRI